VILNAREALPEGGTVSIRAKNVAVHLQEGLPLPEGQYLRLSIEDRGCGIPEQIVSKIFDPYFSTKQRGNQKGMGLGLTICHSIIKNHGGYIQVESQVNRGTTCHVYLPAFKEEAAPVLIEAKGPSGTKGRVLVMDDEEMVRDYVGMALGQMGYEAEFSKNGEEAIALYKTAMESRRPFNTVILDLTVRGGMGGKETMKRLLEIDPKVEAVISSGYSNDPIMLEYKEYGFKGALAKPFQISQLVEIVSTVEMSP
jgi:CheY-like chemotaxis protein